MRHYRRTPAAVILAIALAASAFVAWKSPRSRASNAPDAIEALARSAQEADTCDAWNSYAAALAQRQRFAEAAEAYGMALGHDAYLPEATVGRARCLAAAGKGDEFFTVMRDLSYTRPKIAVEIFSLPEAGGFTGEARFASLVVEARAQSVD